MAVTLNDKSILGRSVDFINRVEMAMVQGALGLNTPTTTLANKVLAQFAVAVLNNSGNYAPRFALSIATDATVIAAATASGTVALTSGNVATQQASVTDAQISTALGAQLPAYFF